MTLFLLFAVIQFSVSAQTEISLRRPISPEKPMWLIHIDTWIYPDPQKCIDLIPEDIRPFVTFNIALSVSDFVRGKYPFTIAESWVRTCAENRVWVMIQSSSGGPNDFSNTSTEEYEYFYQNYPNFLGFNFCEQAWGFGNGESTLDERVGLFTNLLTIANRYGAYLLVSHTQTMNSPQCNPVGMFKAYSKFASICKKFKDNYIVCEKYTTSRGYYDMESVCLGAYLSGYCGNYGIRTDETAWGDYDPRRDKPYPQACQGGIFFEHCMLTGQTVIDGTELTWRQSILKDGTYTTADGYKAKRFKMFSGFSNIDIDKFRKILDGSVYIPTRDEVINRTRVAIVNDTQTGTTAQLYSTQRTLFTGLYSMDGEWSDNHTWMKKTGRYPAIPTIFKEGEYETGAFETVVKHSGFSQRWNTQQAKVDEFNNLFPEEYTGSIYAGRNHNRWITYNPNLEGNTTSNGSIPFKYNTCEKMEFTFSMYGFALINEYQNQLKIYLNNFCASMPETYLSLIRENVIKIYGASQKPSYTYVNRGENGAATPQVSETWEDGVFTLTVNHNGPLDITINCAGNANDRLPVAQSPVANIIVPDAPPVYEGPRQYEAENFDVKSIGSNDVTSAVNYTAMGYLIFGSNSSAAVRDTVNVLKTGAYKLKTRYSAPVKNITTVDLYVNGVKVVTPVFTQTAATDNESTWNVNIQNINLKAGRNTILFKANASSSSFYLDNIIIEDNSSTSIPELSQKDATIVSVEHYNLMGQKVFPENNDLKGIYIVKNLMSDGRSISKKIFIK